MIIDGPVSRPAETRSIELRGILTSTRVQGDTLYQVLAATGNHLGRSAGAGPESRSPRLFRRRDRTDHHRGQVRRLHRSPARPDRTVSPPGEQADPGATSITGPSPSFAPRPARSSSASAPSRSARPAGSAESAPPTSPRCSFISSGTAPNCQSNSPTPELAHPRGHLVPSTSDTCRRRLHSERFHSFGVAVNNP